MTLLLPRRVLERGSELLHRLVVEPDRRLPRQDAFVRPGQLEVVVLVGGDVGNVSHRKHLQDVQSRLVKTIRRNPADHAAVLKTSGRVAGRAREGRQRVLYIRIGPAVVVGGLREIAGPFQRRRHPVPHDVVALRARRKLLAVEEEQLVLAAGFTEGTTHREAPVFFPQHRLRIAVEIVRLAVRVPVRAPLDVVHRSAESVGAALRDRRDVHAARPPVLGLIAGREHLDLRDRLHVHLQQRPIAAGVHRRDAVHHDVGIAAAADPLRRVVPVGDDAGSEGRQLREAAVADRQVLHRLGVDRERSLAALRLDGGADGAHLDRLRQTADLDRERAHGETIAGGHRDAGALERLEAAHGHLHGVAVGRDVDEHEVAVRVREHVARAGAARFADQRHSRAGNHRALRVFDGPRHGAGGDLRRRGGGDRAQGNHCRSEQRRISSRDHGLLLSSW